MPKQPVKTIDQVEQEVEQEQKEDVRKKPKELVTERGPDGLYLITFTHGGEVPDVLKGKFTSVHKAQATIENYKANAPTQE